MVSWLYQEMELGIVGLTRSGKTTLFNSLTRRKAEIHAFAPAAPEPNVGVAKVPDSRLDGLQAILKPKRVVPAEVKYVDVALTGEKRDHLASDLRAYLSTVDAFIHVVRDFTDEAIPHTEGSIDPVRDIDALNLELALSDLGIIERRMIRINDSLKGARQQERDALLSEQALLSRVKPALDNDIPIREQLITNDEARILENYQFLTSKPILLLVNIGEGQLSQASSIEEAMRLRYPQLKVAAVCAKLEMELTQLSDPDATEFRAALGVVEGVIDRVTRLSYEVLGLLSFFSIASGEIRAWTVTKGTTAHKAAGRIHSDMERGFIRAEVISYSDLLTYGSLSEARKKGHLRLEGKNYVVQDGDVITFLFSV